MNFDRKLISPKLYLEDNSHFGIVHTQVMPSFFKNRKEYPITKTVTP